MQVRNRQDVNMMILATSRYELQLKGKPTTHWSLDENGMERMIYERYFQYVPKLDPKSGPKIDYVEGKTKKDQKIPQEKRLSNVISSTLEKELKEARDVGYVLRKIEIARNILAEVGHVQSDADEYLTNFMERIKVNIKGQLKGLREVRLSNIDALHQHLSLMKAKLLTLNREDAFMGKISYDLKEPLPETKVQSLDELCRHILPETLLKIIYGFIMEKLLTYDPNEDMHLPRAPLRDYLIEYVRAEQEEDDEKMELFAKFIDEDILVKHATSCFTQIVNRKFM